MSKPLEILASSFEELKEDLPHIYTAGKSLLKKHAEKTGILEFNSFTTNKETIGKLKSKVAKCIDKKIHSMNTSRNTSKKDAPVVFSCVFKGKFLDEALTYYKISEMLRKDYGEDAFKLNLSVEVL